MIVLVIVLVLVAVVAVAAIVVAVQARRRLATQRQVALDSQARVALTDRELATSTAALNEARQERDAAEQRATEATARAELAEARTVGVDPDVLWALEQLRSERTWRHSVAVGPDSPSALAGAADPLREALQIELDAAREEVGVEVELDADVPAEITPAGSLLALRAAQELLAPAVRHGEALTLYVRPDGPDLVLEVRSVDQDDEPVTLEPLAVPESADVEWTGDGVRIRRVVP